MSYRVRGSTAADTRWCNPTLILGGGGGISVLQSQRSQVRWPILTSWATRRSQLCARAAEKRWFWCVFCANKISCHGDVNGFCMVFVALFLWPAIWSWGGGHRWTVLKYEKVFWCIFCLFWCTRRSCKVLKVQHWFGGAGWRMVIHWWGSRFSQGLALQAHWPRIGPARKWWALGDEPGLQWIEKRANANKTQRKNSKYAKNQQKLMKKLFFR